MVVRPGKLGGREPARVVELFVELDLAREPARGKTQDDEMPLDAVLARRARSPRDSRRAPTGSMVSAVSSRTSRITASVRRLARFDHAARQRVEMQRRLARAPHHQHLAVAQDGGADGEKRPARDRSRACHGFQF